MDEAKQRQKESSSKTDINQQYLQVLALEETPVGAAIFEGPQFVITFANPFVCQMWGRTHAQVIHKPLFEALPEASNQGFEELLRGVLATGAPYVGHDLPATLYRNGKLDTVYFNFVYSPVRDANGQITAVMVIASEVTGQIEANKKVEESEKQYSFLLKLNDMLSPLSDPVAILEIIAWTAVNHFGADRCYYCEIEDGNAVVRRDASRENLPSVVGVYPLHSFALFKNVVDSGHPIIVDDVHTADVVDDELKPVCISLQIISFVDIPVIKNGKPVGIFCLVQSTPRSWTDLEVALAIETAERTWVTVERAKAEEALKKSEKRLLLATDAAKMGTFIYYPAEDRGDPDMQMLALYGLPPDDTLNLAKALAEIIYPDDRIRYANDVAQALNPGGNGKLNSDIRIIHPDGSVHWMNVTAQTQFEGNPPQAVSMPGVSMDITERKRAEEALKKALQHKDEFINIASHELKTPVTSVKAFLQVVQNRLAREGNEKFVALLSKMDAQIDKLTALIADLVDVTKIEGGKLQFREEYFSFDELVDETIEEVQRTAEKHTIVKKGSTGTTIFGDRGRIGQVIINLLINAIKYSPDASNVIVESKADDNSGVTLGIQDSGIGIPKDMLGKVFERFFRVEGENTQTFAGLGIGLFVASEIIKRQGGSIWVESEEGKGSTFYFSLPREGSKGKRQQEDTFVGNTHQE